MAKTMKGTLWFWTSEPVYWTYPSSRLPYQKPLTHSGLAHWFPKPPTRTWGFFFQGKFLFIAKLVMPIGFPFLLHFRISQGVLKVPCLGSISWGL